MFPLSVSHLPCFWPTRDEALLRGSALEEEVVSRRSEIVSDCDALGIVGPEKRQALAVAEAQVVSRAFQFDDGCRGRAGTGGLPSMSLERDWWSDRHERRTTHVRGPDVARPREERRPPSGASNVEVRGRRDPRRSSEWDRERDVTR